MGEERKTLLIGDILEFGLHKEEELIPLREFELVMILQKLMKLREFYK